MRWHCYIGQDEAVYAHDVEADSVEEAAVIAAQANHIGGNWTVIQMAGPAVRVKVTGRTVYEAMSVSSE